jgi:rod shape-determining protein MreC
MRNLLAFLNRYYPVFLFIGLQSYCIYLMIDNHRYHRSAFLNSSEFVSGRILSAYAVATNYLNLKNENSRLVAENARLRSQLKSAYYIASAKRDTINDTLFKQQYSYLPAKVVYATTGKERNYLTINHGYKLGVRPNMGVIGPDGVVGRVKDVSDYFASIITILHKDFKLSVRVGDQLYLGVLEWGEGNDPTHAWVSNIPPQAKIKVGDRVITSGSTVNYPQGILAGTVEAATLRGGGSFYTIKVKLATNFSTIQNVYIVDPLLAKPQLQVEKDYETGSQ